MIDLKNDLQVLAATIWGEARGEPLVGQQAVASVIVNRANFSKQHWRKQFGDGSIHSACLAPWQFSSWNTNDPNRAKILSLNLNTNDHLMVQILDVAESAVKGELVDNTHGALFYKETTLAWPPSWGPEVPALCVIGHHSFYNLLEHPS